MDGAILLGVAAGAVLVMAVAGALRQHRLDTKLIEIWARYSKKREMRFVPAGLLVGEQMPMMESDDGIRIDLTLSRAGDVRDLFTRVVGRALQPQDVRFRCEARSGDLSDVLDTLATLDTEFDEDFAITSDTDEGGRIAAKMIDGDVRTGLLELRVRRGVRLDYDHGEITLTWRRAEDDPKLLDRGRDVVKALALARPTGAGYR